MLASLCTTAAPANEDVPTIIPDLHVRLMSYSMSKIQISSMPGSTGLESIWIPWNILI